MTRELSLLASPGFGAPGDAVAALAGYPARAERSRTHAPKARGSRASMPRRARSNVPAGVPKARL